jgi:hypothetical protein
MANRTDKGAKVIKGTNPQYLIEKIIRMRIYDCRYWKEECFAVTGVPCFVRIFALFNSCVFLQLSTS